MGTKDHWKAFYINLTAANPINEEAKYKINIEIKRSQSLLIAAVSLTDIHWTFITGGVLNQLFCKIGKNIL